MALQKNRLYAHIVDAQGRVLESGQAGGLSVYESEDGKEYSLAGRPKLVAAANRDQGINFLFLLDNSGSMYDDLDGQATQDAEKTRAFAARQAANDFLLSITSSKDTVGLAAFNTRYSLLQTPVRDRQKAGESLGRFSKPAKDDGYTELYASLVRASQDLGLSKGRRALVVLSDGENFPFFEKLGKENPEFGAKTYRAAESLDEAIRQGVTIFAVNFGTQKDSQLADIARRSGGEVFEARDSAELSNVYLSIREKILTEVLVEYGAKMFSGDKRWVKLGFGEPPTGAEGARYYYTGTVFGKSLSSPPWFFLLLVPIALAALFVISRLKFEKPSISANLSLLYATGMGRGTKVFAVGNKTVIGSDKTADITIAGNSRLESSPVTVVKDQATGRFTIMSDEALTVNNRTTTKKVLEPGDVINFNGTIAVFDDMDLDPSKKTATSTRTWDKTAPRKRKS
jgi:Ca-activated chloride channel family protein